MRLSLEGIAKELVESGLLSDADVSSSLESLSSECRRPDASAFLEELVKGQKLTPYQAETIREGRLRTLVFDEYVVLDKIGQGGMGVVLKAEHRRMKRLVAVKILSAAAIKTPQAVERFFREVEAAAKLSHPNIVTAYDAREYQGNYCLVMEYVAGKDLGAILAQRGPLPVTMAVDFILQAAWGLDYAHRQGLVHRDIKPGNLLLDQEGRIKILDMGLARVGPPVDQRRRDAQTQEPLTQAGQLLGTCDYMAPEQARDTHDVDARADIYSLGCTLYRLLTGEVMYDEPNPLLVLLAHQQSPIPSLRDSRPDVPPRLEQAFRRMVAKRPADRYQTVAELIDDLKACRGTWMAAAGNEEPTAEFVADPANRCVGTSHPTMATVLRQEVGRLDEVTVVRQAAAAENTAPMGFARRLLTVPRRNRWLAAGMGLTGIAAVGLIAATLALRGRPPGGRETERDAGDPDVIAGVDKADVQLAKTERELRPRAANQGSGGVSLAIVPFDAARAREYQEICAKALGVPLAWENSIGMRFILIPPGEFDMGSPAEERAWVLEDGKTNHEEKRFLDLVPSEAPQSRVRITRPFYLACTEVTQAQYLRIMGANPSYFAGSVAASPGVTGPAGKQEADATDPRLEGKDTSRHPVDRASWEDAMEFCRRLAASPQEAAQRRLYGLPSEAQWEYACRAGTETRWTTGDDSQRVPDVTWGKENSDDMTHPVAEKPPNAWGLHDMHGNLREWCADWFSADTYKRLPLANPPGPRTGVDRVLRGGCWDNLPPRCRSAARFHRAPDFRAAFLGFRVACEIPSPTTSAR